MFLFLWSLGFITNHGDFEKVPTVKGKTFTEAKKILEDKGFKVEIQDSLYVDTLPPLTVIKQSPTGETMVKNKRTIYLSINRAQPPLVEMPNMVGFSFRNAEMYLKQLGLKLGDTTRKPDIAKDAILEQLYQGQQIKSGTKIFMGSTISLVLGSGLGDDEFDVPDLTNMTFKEAKDLLRGMNLNIGSLVPDPDIKDTTNAIIYKQFPTRTVEVSEGIFETNKIREGQGIDLWLSKTIKEVPKEKEKKEKEKDSPKEDKKEKNDY